MKIIGVVPSVREIYKDQFEQCCDLNLIKFLKKNFPKYRIITLNKNDKIIKKIKLIIICGGNDIIKFSQKKKDYIRQQINDHFFKKIFILNIPVLGICYGAQYLAFKFNSTLKKKRHNKSHNIYLNEDKKKIYVNSFHNIIITKLGKNLICKGYAKDNSIEYFCHVKKKIFGIMWHPERNKNFKTFDKKIIENLLCN